MNINLIIQKLFVFTFFSFYLFGQENYTQEIHGTKEILNFIFIEEGKFTMGSKKSEKGHFGDEGPIHDVKISPFWMSEIEITWDIYNYFMSREIDNSQVEFNNANEVNQEIDAVSSATTPYVEMSFGMGVENYPAICMTQHAAVKFCEWLSALTGKFYRLPTEAEWEYACRAGTNSSYSFGDNIEDLYQYGWFKSNSNESYHKVKQKKPNPWGLYDMHGNVSEWTLDQYIPTIYRTRKKLSVDPFEVPNKVYPKTVRGGSWMDSPSRLRSASRRPSSKKWKKRDPQIPKSIWWHTDAPFVGIRVVRPLNTPNIEKQKKYWNNSKTK